MIKDQKRSQNSLNSPVLLSPYLQEHIPYADRECERFRAFLDFAGFQTSSQTEWEKQEVAGWHTKINTI